MLVRITDSDESVRKRRREGTCTFLKCSDKMVSYPRSTIGNNRMNLFDGRIFIKKNIIKLKDKD